MMQGHKRWRDVACANINETGGRRPESQVPGSSKTPDCSACQQAWKPKVEVAENILCLGVVGQV